MLADKPRIGLDAAHSTAPRGKALRLVGERLGPMLIDSFGRACKNGRAGKGRFHWNGLSWRAESSVGRGNKESSLARKLKRM